MTVAVISVLPYSGCDQITKVHVNTISDNPVDLSCSVSHISIQGEKTQFSHLNKKYTISGQQ